MVWQGTMVKQSCSLHVVGKQRQGGTCPLQRCVTSDLPLSPTFQSFHHFPEVPPAGDQAFRTWAMGNIWLPLNLPFSPALPQLLSLIPAGPPYLSEYGLCGSSVGYTGPWRLKAVTSLSWRDYQAFCMLVISQGLSSSGWRTKKVHCIISVEPPWTLCQALMKEQYKMVKVRRVASESHRSNPGLRTS